MPSVTPSADRDLAVAEAGVMRQDFQDLVIERIQLIARRGGRTGDIHAARDQGNGGDVEIVLDDVDRDGPARGCERP